MKKFLAILMTICLLAGTFCVPAFAADSAAAPADDVVLRVGALKKDGTLVVIKDYKIFDDGWNAAMELADDRSKMKEQAYERVVVDIYYDWHAEDGQFTDSFFNGAGFDWDAIYIQDGVKITLNLNGHTIDRGLTSAELNGEVICVDEKADLIINNGTIKGGYSDNGAGGIHIKDGANVTLNNVNIVDNRVDDDDGAGIAVYNGAILTVNGGSFVNNVADVVNGSIFGVQGSAIYVEDSTAIFKDVAFKGNQVGHKNVDGAAIYAGNSDITVSNCTFEENGLEDSDKKLFNAPSVIYCDESSVTVSNSTFTKNGATALLELVDSEFFMDGGKITGNSSGALFSLEDTDADILRVTITDNTSKTLYINNDDEMVTMMGCTLGNNTPATDAADVETEDEGTLVIMDCILNDTTFSDEDHVKVTYSEVTREDAMIGVIKLHADGTRDSTYYRFFEYGWNLAIEAAQTNEYDRVIVDLYADWNAIDGQFTDEFNNGAGFNWDAIYFPANVKVTLNLNGHTINRGLTEDEMNGEVMYVDQNADVIINDGTITGGFSNNGAGGIHINDGATVTLNNVNVDKNKVQNDDGGGIAVYDGATLIMNGGSVSNNAAVHGFFLDNLFGGGIYVEDSTVILTGVTLNNNRYELIEAGNSLYGAAIYCDDSTVTMKNCTVDGNGVPDDPDREYDVYSIIHASDSTLVIENTNFSGNGSKDLWKISTGAAWSATTLICVNETELTITGGKMTNNNMVFLVALEDGKIIADGVDFTGNDSLALYVRIPSSKVSAFNNCRFSAGSTFSFFKSDFHMENSDSGLVFTDCDLGEATFDDKSTSTFIGCNISNGAGSFFGEGSLTNILVIISLIASGTSIFLTVYYNKKKTAPVSANGAAESDDED